MNTTDPTPTSNPLPDKQALLDDLAATVRAAHEGAEQHTLCALQLRIKCGEALIQGKAAAGHGHFNEWVKKSCRFKKRQAERYMEVARLAKAAGEKATSGTHLAAKSLKQTITYLKSLDPNYQPPRRKTSSPTPKPAMGAPATGAPSTAPAPLAPTTAPATSPSPPAPLAASPAPSVEPPTKFAAIRRAEEKIRAAYEAVERVMKINQTELAADAVQLRARRNRGVDAAFDGVLDPTCDGIDRLAAALVEGQAVVELLRAALGMTVESQHDDRRVA